MISPDNIDNIYSLGYVNVNHVIKNNKLSISRTSKRLEEMINRKILSLFEIDKMALGYTKYLGRYSWLYTSSIR